MHFKSKYCNIGVVMFFCLAILDFNSYCVFGSVFTSYPDHCYFFSTVRPPASTPPTPGNCSSPSWIPNGGYCYTVFVNNGRSWPEANYQCRKSGMELVSVHSKAEMDFVFNLVTQAKVTDPQNKPNIWLGLSKGAQGMLW